MLDDNNFGSFMNQREFGFGSRIYKFGKRPAVTLRMYNASVCWRFLTCSVTEGFGRWIDFGMEQVQWNFSCLNLLESYWYCALHVWSALQNSLDKLSFSKVVSARTQVVQGTMYHLTIEVQEGGNPRLYDAKVWVKPWENFKKLEEFKPAVTPSTFTSADLGTRTGTWAVHLFACVQVVIFSGPSDLQWSNFLLQFPDEAVYSCCSCEFRFAVTSFMASNMCLLEAELCVHFHTLRVICGSFSRAQSDEWRVVSFEKVAFNDPHN